ncbi:MAG: PglB [Clostridia bacterium]|nr:PglB [Clostridia bacterium]
MNINKNLLILGAGQYGQVAKEVAESMGCFEKIAFLDDNSEQAIGKLEVYENFVTEYSYAFVAIGSADIRLKYIEKLEEACFRIALLVSPKAFISSSAQLMKGTIVEPMAVVNANSTVAIGCLVCAGAIVNHNSFVGDGCQLDCGSVVGSRVILTARTHLKYNEVFDKDRAEIALRCPPESYKFEDGV